jgi:Mlc titration factor MtfA (ptsG expression regulator)
MLLIWGLLALPVVLTAWVIYRSRQQNRERTALLASRLTPSQRDVMLDAVPLISRLPDALQTRLEGKVQLFLDQVQFICCDGLEITDEIRLSIAAEASLLVVNSQAWYSDLTTVLVYPGAFKSRQQRYDGYVVREAEIVRSGESWTRGPVILSWAHTRAGADNPQDGHNVVLHEFAHQLDDLSGQTDGVPLMAEGQNHADWERVMLDAFDRHIRAVNAGRATQIDTYGAESIEEFFAVSVEMFFEKPEQLHEVEPEVYDQLSEMLQLDPKGWG